MKDFSSGMVLGMIGGLLIILLLTLFSIDISVADLARSQRRIASALERISTKP